jgi:hypothetical protein
MAHLYSALYNDKHIYQIDHIKVILKFEDRTLNKPVESCNKDTDSNLTTDDIVS